MTGTRQDFSERDRTIRLNSYTTVLRREEVSHADFAAYWRDVHGPLCSRLPGLGWYVQHHFSREQDAHLWPRLGGVGPLPGYVLDGAVEIGFASAEDQQTFQAASPLLFSDEQNMFAESLAHQLPDGSVTSVDAEEDPHPNAGDPGDRTHLHLSARPGALEDLRSLVAIDLTAALTSSADLVKLRRHAPEPRAADADDPPAPGVAHGARPERRELVVLEVAFRDRLARRRVLESDAVQEVLARVATATTHITPFPVSGVYTFVRDGQLTTAGLRGSRAAELIRDLAATNQTTDEVGALFRRG